MEQRAEAARMIESRIMDSDAQASDDIVRYVVVQYNFGQLKDWADQLIPIFESKNVVLIDVDEVHNRVYVGVVDEEAREETLAYALELGVPHDAIEVEVIEPYSFTDLQAYTLTLMGGYQIDAYPAEGECTLGFNARFDNMDVFVTNSHCTRQRFVADGQPFFQPLFGQGVAIGMEVADMGPKFCGPYVDPYCRDSDAAIIKHESDASRQVAQGRIARGYRAPWPGIWGGNTLVYDPPHRTTQLHTSAITVGMVVDKTGRTTGQTWGYVTQTCVDVNPQYESWWLRCQVIAGLGAEGGDSGSPVYRQLPGDNYDVALIGIVWGGQQGSTNTAFSRLSGIQADLGQLSAMCAAGYGC